jgi:hypothetical protein
LVVSAYTTAYSALVRGRFLAEDLMRDEVTITRATGSASFDENTGRETAGTPTTVYTGPCRVQRRNVAEQTPEAGERTVTVQDVELHVPVTATGIDVGDLATINSAALDPELVGRRFRVVGLAHKTFATARRLRCEEVTG